MKLFALLLILFTSQTMTQENLELDSVLSILAKPKLAMATEGYSMDAIRS